MDSSLIAREKRCNSKTGRT
uniref:Uncharacterized protein n=1 Tax=Arundo donax TaxID=35708 RepID=A0A0A8Z2E5_ARUDO